MNLKELRVLEKQYFDTYKNKKSSEDKAIHLEEMAQIIRKIQKLEENGTCQTKKKKC
jgi:hypothetical protein